MPAGEAIATLNAIVRMDSSGLQADIGKAREKLTGFEKGLKRGSLSAEKLGSVIAGKFFGVTTAIGLAIKAVDNFGEAWRQMSLLVQGGSPAEIKKEFEELAKFEKGWNFTANLAAGIVGDKTVQERLKELQASLSEIQTKEAIISLGRKRREMEARLADARTGTHDATRALELQQNRGEDVAMKHRIEDLTDLRSRLDSVMGSLKSQTDKLAESQQTLNDAHREGLITLEEYERALSRLKQSSGHAVEINTRTAIRASAATSGTSNTGGGFNFKSDFAEVTQFVKAIHDVIQRDSAAARIR